MLSLGFVSAILPDLTLEEVFAFAKESGYSSVEVMCWPKGKAERRYAGITHIDVVGLGAAEADQVKELMAKYDIGISGLGYYPNPLAPDEAEAAVYVEHIKAVIKASRTLGIGVMNTFVGRDYTRSVDENWPRFLATWKPILEVADAEGVKIGIENCPMSFTKDEWPGGKNLATSPVIWRRMFNDIPSANFGLNFDPSHFVWQRMDYCKVLYEFKDRLHHMHAKDARLDQERLDQVGALAFPNLYHTPKLPGLGDVNWSKFFSALTECYSGPVAVEVEDRAFEGSLEERKHSLRISSAYLKQFIG